MTRRRKALRALRRIQGRLDRLFRAEKKRDEITAERKHYYLVLSGRLPDDHPKVKRALRRYRASLRLSRRVDHSEQLLRDRAKHKRDLLDKLPKPIDPDHDGLVMVDGKPVTKEIALEVKRIRAAGRWKGVVVSGWRSPEFSKSLCRAMCGADQCPGRCAGVASRHAQLGRAGAIDVSDFDTFEDECARLGSWLENHLPNDPVHFSDIGN